MKKAPIFSFKYILFDFVKWFGFWQTAIFYRIKKTYDGEEAKKRIKGGAIIACNHVGFSDPFLLLTMILYRRLRFVCMEELFSNPVKNFLFKYVFLCKSINRDKPSIGTIKELSALAEAGNVVCIFPEGHINIDKEHLDPCKGGAVFMAYKANVPIIPIYHRKRKSIWNMTHMVIGKPINVREMIGETLTQDKLNQVSKYLFDYENSLMELLEEKYPTK